MDIFTMLPITRTNSFFQSVEHQPWAEDRPYNGGYRHNCMAIHVNNDDDDGDDDDNSRVNDEISFNIVIFSWTWKTLAAHWQKVQTK